MGVAFRHGPYVTFTPCFPTSHRMTVSRVVGARRYASERVGSRRGRARVPFRARSVGTGFLCASHPIGQRGSGPGCRWPLRAAAARFLFRSAHMKKPAIITIKPCDLPPKASGCSSAAREEASKRRVIRMPPRPLATPRRGWAMNLRPPTAKRKRGSLPCAFKAEALTSPCVSVRA